MNFTPRNAILRWLLLGFLATGACGKAPVPDSKVAIPASGTDVPRQGSDTPVLSQSTVDLPEKLSAENVAVAKEPPAPSAAKLSVTKSPNLLVDLHADTLHQLVHQRTSFDKRIRGELNPAAAVKGALNGQFFAVWVDPDDLNLWAVALFIFVVFVVVFVCVLWFLFGL